MADVNYTLGTWVSVWPDALFPDQSHEWVMWGFPYGAVLSVTAHPLTPSEIDAPQVLAVENQRIFAAPDGARIVYDVHNIGPQPVYAYGIGVSVVSS